MIHTPRRNPYAPACAIAAVHALTLTLAGLAPAATDGAEVIADRAPFEQLQSIELPGVPPGPYADHMAVDVAGQRLFTTPQAARAVVVIDLAAGRVLESIRAFDDPHAILFLPERHRLFVTDGAGWVAVIDSDRYRRLKRIPLARDADNLAFEPRSGLLYVGNGGEEAGMSDSRISLIDTSREQVVGEITIQAASLEAMIIDAGRNRLYVNAPDENAIWVIDLARREPIARWALKLGRRNDAFALDGAHDRLYVGCNEGDVRGALVVVDTASGRELERLPLGSWVDSMAYDAKRERLYASTGIGELFSYARRADGLSPLPSIDTAVMARTSLFEPALDRLFVMVPHLGWTSAKVLVFRPR